MKENKEHQIKVRITASQKAAVNEYCAAMQITVSELLRQALQEYLNGGKNNG